MSHSSAHTAFVKTSTASVVTYAVAIHIHKPLIIAAYFVGSYDIDGNARYNGTNISIGADQ